MRHHFLIGLLTCMLSITEADAKHRVAVTDRSEQSNTGAGWQSLPPRIPKGEGVIFARQPGDRVSLVRPSGEVVCQLSETQHVKFIKESAAVGEGDSTATIEACGTQGILANARVLVEKRLQRSPDGTMAVYHAISTCGDGCHAELWLLGPGQRRILLSDDAGAEARATWRGRELQVTVDHGIQTDDNVQVETETLTLSLPDLAALNVTYVDKLQDGPKGALFVASLTDGAPRIVGTRRWQKAHSLFRSSP